MKTKVIPLLLLSLLAPLISVSLAETEVRLMPEEDPETGETQQLVWETEPGVRYEVQSSGNLHNWVTEEGYPVEASGTVDAFSLPFPAGNAFYRVLQIDEQAPEIVERTPEDDDFAVRRFSSIVVTLADETGIDPASLILEVGDLGSFTTGDAEVEFVEDTMTFDSGSDTALGNFGEEINITLTVADTLGNAATYDWVFKTEVEPVVSENLFVFGSPGAQRAGQQLREIPARVLARQQTGGAVRMNANAEPWELSRVETDRVVLRYEGEAPSFSSGQEIANLEPATVEEIFYRRITSVSDDPANQELKLMTEDLESLEEIIDQGSATVSEESYLLEIGEDGTIIRAVSLDARVDFDPLGFSLDGAHIGLRDDGFGFAVDDLSFSQGDDPDYLTVDAEELHFWLTPYVRSSLEIGWGGLNRFEGAVGGDVDAAIVMDVNADLAGSSVDIPLLPSLAADPPHNPIDKRPNFWIYMGQIGIVPVYAQVLFDISLTAEAEASAALNFRAGIRQTGHLELGLEYDKEREPAVDWIQEKHFPTEVVRPETSLDGELSLKLKLEPAISFLVYGLAGAEGSVAPRGGVVFAANDLTGDTTISGQFEADVSLNLRPDGPALAWLDPTPELSYTFFEHAWHLFPEMEELAFITQPQDTNVVEGETASFYAAVNRKEGVRYVWYRDYPSLPLPRGGDSFLEIPSAQQADSGTYRVAAFYAGNPLVSDPFTLTVRPRGEPLPGPIAELQQNGFVFRITEGQYEPGAWESGVAEEFGDDWRVADWNEIKSAFGSTREDAVRFATFVDTYANGSASVKRNGRASYSSSRFYFVSAHFGSKPSYYLAHDNMQSYQVSLGSWTGTRQVVAVKPDNR